MIAELENLQDVTFVDDCEVNDILEQMIQDFQTKYEEITGDSITLAKSDPYRIILQACSLQHYQMLKFLDEMGKQNLLKYAEGVFLDQIGALRGVKRLQGSKAITTIRFNLEEAREDVTAIPKGIRVAADDVYFETTEYAEIEPGNTYVDVLSECTEIGTDGNGFAPGEVNAIVDSVAFIASAVNLTKTEGGEDIESDENFSDRIYLATAGYSVAGPTDAYKYFVKESDATISDVSVTSTEPGTVDIRFIMNGGLLPTKEIIEAVTEYISDKNRRPLTDNVKVASPEIVTYDINLKYWIAEDKRNIASAIQEQIQTAIQEYIDWQNSAIGRDVNPSELTYRVMKAGAKRVEITAPVFTEVGETSVAQNTSKIVSYGGVENG